MPRSQRDAATKRSARRKGQARPFATSAARVASTPAPALTGAPPRAIFSESGSVNVLTPPVVYTVNGLTLTWEQILGAMGETWAEVFAGRLGRLR